MLNTEPAWISDGQLGGDFFSAGLAGGAGRPGNMPDRLRWLRRPADHLRSHEYQLDYDGGSWALTDLDSGGSVALSGTGTRSTHWSPTA